MDVQTLIDEAEARLRRSPAIDHWPAQRERWESETLLAHVVGEEDPDDLDPDEPVSGPAARRFRELVRRRAGGEPMAHIVGHTQFRGLRVRVKPGSFVPRQSSEFLAVQAVRRLHRRRRPIHVDLATGIGPVALAVAHEAPHARVHGSDLLEASVRQARANARALGLSNVRFHRGDLFASLPRSLRGNVDVITLHPPYVPRDELHDLPLEVRGFEPQDVLTDFSDHGLDLVERTAEEAPEWLRADGWVLIEVSPDRARAVKSVLRRAGLRDPRSTRGWPEVTRVVVARR